MKRACVTVLLVVGFLGAPSVDRAAAQDTTLDRVETLIRSGEVPGARALLDTWWAATRDRVSRDELERALWLRARLTLEVDAAAFLLRRLVREFPEGAFAEAARERLALLGPGDAEGRT